MFNEDTSKAPMGNDYDLEQEAIGQISFPNNN